jgi:CRP-like cAMP-binding protein
MIPLHLQPKGFAVPHETHVDEDNEHTREAAIAALKIPPTDRTSQDIDAILAIVGTWQTFNRFFLFDQVRREVCRQMRLESHEANTILFKQGDDPDGWYLVFSGRCSIYIRSHGESFHFQILAHVVTVLRDAFGPEACFCLCAVKGPTQEFGSTALVGESLRNTTVVVDEFSQILRVDHQHYRETTGWFDRVQLEKKISLLSHIPEFQFLRDSRDIFSRLADNMKELKLERLST